LNDPIISVLIPTFNYARFLPEAIDSVLRQDFGDFELLIADDCSTDDTANVVKPYCARDARVQFAVHSTNMGMVNNWNYCLQRARGQYIKFVFGDDKLFRPNALSKMLGMLEGEPSATLAASARVILDEASHVVNLWRSLGEGRHEGRRVIEKCLMRNGENIVGEPSAVLFRKADAQRGFHPAYRQIVDVEMWFHLLEKGDLVYTREPLCAFRVHSLQQTEVNTVTGAGGREHAIFFSNYASQEWLPRKVVLPILGQLRRKRRKKRDPAIPETAECEKRLVEKFGAGLGWAYLWWYVGYRLTKPFLNAYYSAQKRIARLRYGGCK
jgi:hypothetical protein